MGKLFGTDGIRGLANRFPMNGETVMAVGRAIAHVLQTQPDRSAKRSLPVGLTPLDCRASTRRAKIVVGKDTRLANYMIENALVSGLCSMGADVYLIGPLTTPGVAFVTQSMRADAGIMISASHNPYQDTGVKVFTADGFKLPDELEGEIEDLVFSDKLEDQRPTNGLIGKAFRIDDAIGRYVVFLKSFFPRDLDLQGMRVVVDCANGAAYKVAPLVFEELGAEVIRLGVDPNGMNINENCGALHPDQASTAVMEYRADLGISLDGDGDRCILSDEKGEVVDGDQIIGLCALQMAKDKTLLKNTVVTTPMSNVGLELTLQRNGIKMVRAQVGDRYVVETMRREGYNLGGEQSGHIIFLDQSTTGDGIVAALRVLESIKRSGKPLSELKKAITLYPQVQQNIPVSKKLPLEEVQSIQQSIERARKALNNHGRVFVRYSGTEPLARVLLEGQNEQEIYRLSEEISRAILKELG